jgi:hypothetical protein
VHESSIGVTFPDRLGDFALKGRTQFPKAADGATIVYESEGVRGAIYVYDAGVKEIPNGVGSPVIHKHFRETEMALKRASTEGPVKATVRTVKTSTISAFPGCGPQFVWRSDAIAMEGHEMVSRTYLAGYHGRFVKLRVTQVARDGDAQADAFVQGVRKLLGHCA